MSFTGRRLRQRNTVLSGFLTGALVHAFAVVAFAALVLLKMEGCNAHDGRAGTLTAAVMVDLLLTGPLLWIVVRTHRNGRLAVLAGWALSLVSALALLTAAAVHLNSLPAGCPV
ncbi:hypothetical protein ACNAW0_11625 [Micromonospora sp. SL1-18]|uniref:hypothetical protein n=1 Tax=Micromonospora sp. SL1-18 TaxID=3399128 RepID=UPI003A4DF1BA